MKKLVSFLLILLLLGISFYFWSLRPADSSSQDRHTVTISSGTSVRGIAEMLEDKGIIRSSMVFMVYTKLQGKEGSLEAGKFILRPSMSVSEIVSILQDGRAEEMLVTIPEGFTVRDIDQLLSEKGLIEEGDIEDCANRCDFETFGFLPGDTSQLAKRGGKLEGYLFPDTYFVNVSEFVPKFFLERMLGAFRKQVIDQHGAEIGESGRSLHELVTMASLIEEETRKDDERALVSGILWKRYDDGRGLGVDATVRYIIDKPTAVITLADLNTNSQYNTRKLRGLPPGPIANAGIESFQAALRPEESTYWYYLHGDDGVIRYAESNEEHNVNRWRYIK